MVSELEMVQRRGRKPTPVYIDGEEVDSISHAMKILKLGEARRGELHEAADNNGTLCGHAISWKPPRRVYRERTAPVHHPGEPLLRGHCTHRLGAYKGGRW